MITGIQRVGIGVSNISEAWKWYRDNFGMDIPMVDSPGTADFVAKYTGDKPHDFHNIVAINMQGGGGFDIWQYMSRKPKYNKSQIKLGDIGVFAAKIKAKTLKSSYLKFRLEDKDLVNYSVQKCPENKEHFFVTDRDSNHFQVIENKDVYKETDALTGGVMGAIIGVSDMEKSLEFYEKVLGYDKIIYNKEGIFRDFSSLPGGENKFKRVLLTHSKKRKGAFSELLGASEIELLQVTDREPVKIYENRFLGDIGLFDISFAVQSMEAIKKHCKNLNYTFTVDSLLRVYENPGVYLTMPELTEHFAYIEDPDGNLIRFIETYNIEISEKMGWKINIKKRNPQKTIPKWQLKKLAWNRFEEE